MNPRKKYFFYFLMSISAILFFGFTGEILSRIFFKGLLDVKINSKTQDVLKENPHIIKFKPFVHSHFPHSEYKQQGKHFSVDYKINSLGLRDNEIKIKKEAGKKRLLIVGDSVTEGHGVNYEQTYVYILKKKLEQENWEVINAGTQGAGLAYQALNLPRYFQLNPDAILFATYENDLADDRRIEIHYNEYPVLENPSIFYLEPSFGFFFKSKLFQVGYVFFYKYIRSKNEIEKLIKQNSKLIKKISTPQQLTFRSLSFLHPSVIDTAWEMTSKYYDYVQKETNERNIPFLVVNLTYQPYESGFDPIFTQSTNLLDERLEKYFSEKQISYLAMKQLVREYYVLNPASLGIPEDGHPNAEGHRFFASALYPWLTENLSK